MVLFIFILVLFLIFGAKSGFLKPFFCALKNAPQFFYHIVKDFIGWIKSRGWEDFHYWGLHLFLGEFGSGKTISAVRQAYWVCKTHRNVTVLTNISLKNFPADTNIIKYEDSFQILSLPDKSIVLIDEIGSVFNSRDYGAKKVCVPKPVYQFVVQCRHRRVMILGTSQDWSQVDRQLRIVTNTITICHSWFRDPFTRYTTCTEYKAKEYDRSYQNPMLPIKRSGYYAYVQTDELRSLYDTREMVDTMLTKEYLSDEEILANHDFGTSEFADIDKKTGRRFNKNIRKLR